MPGQHQAKERLSGESWELKRTWDDLITLPCGSNSLSDPISQDQNDTSYEDGTVVFKAGSIRDLRFKMWTIPSPRKCGVWLSLLEKWWTAGQHQQEPESSAKTGRNLASRASYCLALLKWVPSAVLRWEMGFDTETQVSSTTGNICQY